MTTVTVQFEGICCHIDPPAGAPVTAERRAVLPTVHDHICYIEVFTNDVDTTANPDFVFSNQYTRENASYRRVEINNAKVELLNVTAPPFATLPSFEQRVPSLKAVEPRFTAVKDDLLATTIPSGTVAAYFDIDGGMLSGGPSEHFRTVFTPTNAWPVRHLAQWVQLETEVSGTAPRLRVTDLATGATRDLVLKDGADLITIGNQMESDINGQPGSSGHFDHYYELSPVAIPNAPKPKISAGLGVGCADTRWP